MKRHGFSFNRMEWLVERRSFVGRARVVLLGSVHLEGGIALGGGKGGCLWLLERGRVLYSLALPLEAVLFKVWATTRC